MDKVNTSRVNYSEDGNIKTTYYESGRIKTRSYYKDGKIHKEDGPAFIFFMKMEQLRKNNIF